MVALSGIIKRSTKGDNLMVGRREYPIDKVIEFTQENYKNFERHSLAWTVSTYTPNDEFAEETNKLKTPKDIQEFIEVNFSKLDGLRRSLDKIVDNMSQIILRTLSGDLSHIVCNSKPIYVGCAINYVDKEPTLIEYYKDDIKNGLKIVSKSSMVLISEIIHVLPTIIRLYSYYKFFKVFV